MTGAVLMTRLSSVWRVRSCSVWMLSNRDRLDQAHHSIAAVHALRALFADGARLAEAHTEQLHGRHSIRHDGVTGQLCIPPHQRKEGRAAAQVDTQRRGYVDTALAHVQHSTDVRAVVARPLRQHSRVAQQSRQTTAGNLQRTHAANGHHNERRDTSTVRVATATVSGAEVMQCGGVGIRGLCGLPAAPSLVALRRAPAPAVYRHRATPRTR